VQAHFCLDILGAELLDAGGTAARTAEVGVEAMTMPVSVTLDFDAGPGGEPGREGLEGTDGELVETKVGAPGL